MSKDYFIHRAGTAEVMEDGFYELSGAEKIASDLAHQNPGVEFYVAMRYTRFLVEPARPADDGTATELAADTAKVMLRGLEQAPGRVVGSNPFETEADWRYRVESRLAALEKDSQPPIDLTPAILGILKDHGFINDLKTTAEPMSAFPAAAPECKGAWALGTACGKCARCRQSAPPEDHYEVAVALVREFKKASPALVQRKMHLGYNAACDLIEQMEREGIVSRKNAAGKRELLKP